MLSNHSQTNGGLNVPDSLEKFKYTLPYASEASGIYQPILGWRSQRTLDRFRAGLEAQEASLFKLIHQVLKARYGINRGPRPRDVHAIQWILPASRLDFSPLPFSPEISS